jgi:hypothetical protein
VNDICYGPEPLPGGKVGYHLTISANGRVCLVEKSMPLVLLVRDF